MTTSPRKSALFVLTGACFFAIPAQGQSWQINGPRLGWVHHTGSRSIRPVIGVPGSAYLGAPLAEDLSLAAVSPDGKAALIRKEETLSLLRLADAAAPAPLLGEPLTAVTAAAWAPDGSAIVLYEASTRRIQIIRTNASDFAVDTPFDMPADGILSELAIGPGGSPVIAGLSGESVAGLYRIERGFAQRIDGIRIPVSPIFTRDGSRLIVADAETRQIAEYDTISFSRAAGTPEDTVDASALAVSGDSGTVYVLSHEAGTLAIFDRTSWQRRQDFQLEFKPRAFTALQAMHVYGLSAGSEPGDPVWILDGRTSAIYFVPGGGSQ